MKSLKYFYSIVIIIIVFLQTGYSHAATIDLMIVYDTTAKTWVDSHGGAALFAQDAVARMNKAMLDSNIDLEFNLVKTEAISYTHTSLNADLDALKSKSGVFASVHDARDSVGADLVAMFVDTGSAYGAVGLGYSLLYMFGQPDYGLTVNAIQAVAITHTMTHEIGHNLGAGHSKFQLSEPGPNSYLNNYSAGWYFTGSSGKKYHTIMAYNDDGYGNIYSEAPFFSSPLQTYDGVAAGHAEDGDNARCIRDTMGVVAEYRSRALSTYNVTATAGEGGSVSPSTAAVESGKSATFYITENSGYTKESTVAGTCPAGSWNGNTYTTGAITADCSVSFSFTKNPVNYGLTVSTSGVGSGTVASSPVGINCGGDCSENFPENTNVTLTATPSAGSKFSGWTGSVSSSSSSVNITIDSAKTMNARFDLDTSQSDTTVINNLSSSTQNRYIKGTAGKNTIYQDYGGHDAYTILPGLIGNVEIIDSDASTIYFPAGLNISAVRFLSDKVVFTINGFTLTLGGDPSLSTFIFGGMPMSPAAGISRTYGQTAQLFGTTIPAAGQPFNAATITGIVQGNGSLVSSTANSSTARY